MDGFVKMVKEMTEVALIGLSLVKETVSSMAPRELSLSIQYLWDGMMGLGNWMGYALAAGYYIGLDLGVGETVCEIFGYGYYIVDGLYVLVDFSSGLTAKGEGETAPEEVAAGSADAATPAATDGATEAGAETTATTEADAAAATTEAA